VHRESGQYASKTLFIFIRDTDNYFPDEDFFPDMRSVYNDMGDNTANVNGSSSALYVFMSLLFELLLQLFVF
jgi:hypothetical protein